MFRCLKSSVGKKRKHVSNFWMEVTTGDAEAAPSISFQMQKKEKPMFFSPQF